MWQSADRALDSVKLRKFCKSTNLSHRTALLSLKDTVIADPGSDRKHPVSKARTRLLQMHLHIIQLILQEKQKNRMQNDFKRDEIVSLFRCKEVTGFTMELKALQMGNFNFSSRMALLPLNNIVIES
ncbi:hypothetical protein T4E_572 [Trichinella pseudospiralis]|uniref:Uncharacterized protein n=1 Tax=Trichinella pseudospiralis TaxID=6337 RepID=A0A0V0XXW8_TRIPS|nr:hypothetical protein T4E_572 [Trichinella pseudospiralis]